LANSKDSAGNPATSLKNITTPSIDSLKNDLVQMINRMISPSTSSFSYQNLNRMVGDDPVAKQAAQEIATAISTNIEAIYRATVDGAGTNAVNSAFVELVKDGIAPAQNTLAYDNNSGGVASKPRFGTGEDGGTIISVDNGPFIKYDPKNNPEHKEINDRMLAGKL
jgi:hypothetical protein